VGNASGIWSSVSNHHATSPLFGDIMKPSKNFQCELTTMGNAVMEITVWPFLTCLLLGSLGRCIRLVCLRNAARGGSNRIDLLSLRRRIPRIAYQSAAQQRDARHSTKPRSTSTLDQLSFLKEGRGETRQPMEILAV
jgi:hypothetical protein